MAKKQVTETKQVDIFRVFKGKNGKYVIICGNAQVVAKEFETMAEAEKYIKQKPWDLIINTTLFVTKSAIINNLIDTKQ